MSIWCCSVLPRAIPSVCKMIANRAHCRVGQEEVKPIGVTPAMATGISLDVGGQHVQHRPQARRQHPKLLGNLLVGLDDLCHARGQGDVVGKR